MKKEIEIWGNYILARQQLFENKTIRSFNNPVEDFSEWLVGKLIKVKSIAKDKTPKTPSVILLQKRP